MNKLKYFHYLRRPKIKRGRFIYLAELIRITSKVRPSKNSIPKSGFFTFEECGFVGKEEWYFHETPQFRTLNDLLKNYEYLGCTEVITNE